MPAPLPVPHVPPSYPSLITAGGLTTSGTEAGSQTVSPSGHTAFGTGTSGQTVSPGSQTTPRTKVCGQTATLGGPTARTYTAPSSPASLTSAAPRAALTTFGAPRSALNSSSVTRGPGVYDYGRTTRGPGALPAPLLTSPLGCARATSTASTSAVAVGEGHTGGTFDQSSFDDHTGKVGLPAFGRQTYTVGHFGANLVVGTLLHLRHPCQFELASCHRRRFCCLDR
jgi:hypothetical protein